MCSMNGNNLQPSLPKVNRENFKAAEPFSNDSLIGTAQNDMDRRYTREPKDTSFMSKRGTAIMMTEDNNFIDNKNFDTDNFKME